MSNQGSQKWVDPDLSDSDSEEAHPAPANLPALPPYVPAPPPNVPAPPANFQAPANVPPPPPLPGGPNHGGARPKRPLPPNQTLDRTMREAHDNRGVWNEDTKSYEFRLPRTTRKVNQAANQDFPKQSATAVHERSTHSIIPQGAEREPYRSYNYEPETSYANVTHIRGNNRRIALVNREHTFYPPPRVIFPETTGIERTNQPRYQEIPENLRYAAYGRPNESYHPRNRVTLSNARPPQDKEELRGSPMSVLTTDPTIKSGRFDQNNRREVRQGRDYRLTPVGRHRRTMEPVRTMPSIPAGQELVIDPNATRETARWNPRSRRVVEIHPGTYDRTQGGRVQVRGIARTDDRLPKKIEYAEEDGNSDAASEAGSLGYGSDSDGSELGAVGGAMAAPEAGPTPPLAIALRLRDPRTNQIGDIGFEFFPDADTAESLAHDLAEDGIISMNDEGVVAANLNQLVHLHSQNISSSVTFAMNRYRLRQEPDETSLVGYGKLLVVDKKLLPKH